MITQGQTVFYRLSEENVQDVNFQRDRERIAATEAPTGHVFHGAKVEVGMVLPAEVVKCYTEFEWGVLSHAGAQANPEVRSRSFFSGYADLRVKLPGNDVLWAPRARWDEYPRHVTPEEGYGVGLTVVPAPGKFTMVPPAPLV